MSGRITALKNKIMKLESSASFKMSLKKDNEVILAKQDLQCLQVEKDSVQLRLDKCHGMLLISDLEVIKLNKYIDTEESKKLKNRFKKLLGA